MDFSRVKNLILDGKTLTTELENMETKLEDYILTKLERVNKALDKILPSRVHRKLVATALRIFKILLRTYTTMFIHAPILLLKLVLKFIFSEFWISILKRKKSSSGLESDGSRAFQDEDCMKLISLELNNLLDEILTERGSDENLSAMIGVKDNSIHHKMGISGGGLQSANPHAGNTVPNLPVDDLSNKNLLASERAKDKNIPADKLGDPSRQTDRLPLDGQKTESDDSPSTREGVKEESTHDKVDISGVKLQGTNLPSASPSDPNSV